MGYKVVLHKNTSTRKHKKTIVVISLVIMLVILLDIFIFGIAKFGYHTFQCGKVPVAVNTSSFKGGSTYLLPGNYLPGLWTAETDYVCTENEAINRGVQKDPYDNQPILNNETFISALSIGMVAIIVGYIILRSKLQQKS